MIDAHRGARRNADRSAPRGRVLKRRSSPHREISTQASVPITTHDAITQPARLPPELPIVIDVRATPLAPPPERAKSDSMVPKLDEMDEGWDLGDADPTAATPSSSEMAGDGSVEGDGLDQVD